VRIGAVQSILLQYDSQTHTAYIPVTVQLEPDRMRVSGPAGVTRMTVDLSDLVKQGLRAELVTQSFVTGQLQIDLDFDPSTPATLHPSVTALPEIPTRLSTVQRVQAELSHLPLADLVSNANATLKSLRQLSDRLNSDVPGLVTNLQNTAQESSRTVATATTAITALQKRLDDTLTRATQLIATGDRQLSARGADLHTLLISTNQAVRQASAALNEVRSLTSPRGETRANLDSTLRDLASAAASLRGFASDVERNPQLLLTGRRP
jgi:paraquat-inducible protein B